MVRSESGQYGLRVRVLVLKMRKRYFAHSFMNGSSVIVYNERKLGLTMTHLQPVGRQQVLPGRVISFVPEGRGRFEEWGDGDVT